MRRAKGALAIVHQCGDRITALAQQTKQILLAFEQRGQRCVVGGGQRLAEQGMQGAVMTV